METESKRYFNTVINSLRKQCLLFSIQNNPYPSLFHSSSGGMGSAAGIEKHGLTAYAPPADTLQGMEEKSYCKKETFSQNGAPVPVVAMSTTAYSPGGKQENTFIYTIDLMGNIYGNALTSDESYQNICGQSLLNDKRYLKFHRVIFWNDSFYIAADEKLLTADRTMKICKIHTSPYLKGCRDIAVSGNRLFITSSRFDAIIIFDLFSEKFIEGYHIRHNRTANSIYLAPFDPASEKGPPPCSEMALENIFIQQNRLYFSCRAYDHLFYAEENGSLHISLSIPSETDFIGPYREGILVEDKSRHQIVHMDMGGNEIQAFQIDMGNSKNMRQLITINDDIIIALFEPEKVLIYRSGQRDPIKTSDLSECSTENESHPY